MLAPCRVQTAGPIRARMSYVRSTPRLIPINAEALAMSYLSGAG
jgi:hypothetical protein